jgi:hypothetical protein
MNRIEPIEPILSDIVMKPIRVPYPKQPAICPLPNSNDPERHPRQTQRVDILV